MTTLEYISKGAYGSVYSYVVGKDAPALALKHLNHDNTDTVISNLKNIQEHIQNYYSIPSCATIEFVKSIKFYNITQIHSSTEEDFDELIVTEKTPHNAYTMQLHKPLKQLGGIRLFINTICAQLKCIHAHNIIHGDMKLANILEHTEGDSITYIIGDFDGASIATYGKPSITVFTPVFAHPIMYCYNYSAEYDTSLQYLINFTKGETVVHDKITNQYLETNLHTSVFGDSYTLDQLMTNYKESVDKIPYLKYADYYAFLFNIYYKYGIKNEALADFITTKLTQIAKSLGILITTTGGTPALAPLLGHYRRNLLSRQLASSRRMSTYKQPLQSITFEITEEDYKHPIIIGNTLYSVTEKGETTTVKLDNLISKLKLTGKPAHKTPYKNAQ